ncbi:MAG: class I SAM-dependent methyltransferase [Alphaproteobacteria bacterium]|nr:class I SAM-dependent methyltransferase [Alphaproteobacteria bacterium]
MTPLARHLADLIRTSGPISVAQYMAEALGHPKWGYYMSRDPFGRRGDFITAPEVSQMFGEMIGLWCATVWELMGSPRPFRLVELGPGRGTLMADALRAAATMPVFRAAVRVHLVETSPFLRAVQQRNLTGAGVTWHERFAEVPAGPLVLVANELFDALPVRQFQRTREGWRERLVDLDAGEQAFRLVLARGPEDLRVPEHLRAAAMGSVVEVSPTADALADEIGLRIALNGGAALIIDYGAAHAEPRNTLEAVRGHGSHDVFTNPGEADIAAHVDFGQLVATFAPHARVFGPIEQGVLLRNLGIEIRAAMLKRRGDGGDQADIDAALARLTESGQMGSLFKAIGVAHHSLPDLPGFEPRP